MVNNEYSRLITTALNGGEECVPFDTEYRDKFGRPHIKYDGEYLLCADLVLEVRLARKLRPGEKAGHYCQNSGCINANHIYIIYPDEANKRMPKPQQRKRRKLDASDVKEIRELAAAKIPYKAIAERYGVTAGTICKTVKGYYHKEL